MIIRKARRVGSSIVATLPAVIVESFGIKEGDLLGIEIMSNTKISIRKYVEEGEIKNVN